MPEFGKSAGSMAALKKQLKKSSGGGKSAITWISKEPGSMVVRFLEEPDSFIRYEDAWSDAKRTSFPYADGMVEGIDFTRKSWKYLANALDVENDKVVALQLNTTIVNRLVIKYEKYGTITDRDYEIARYGEGRDGTEWDVSPESTQKRNLSKYTPLDLHQVLKDRYDEVFSEDDDDDDDMPSRPKKAGSTFKGGKRKKMLRGGGNLGEDEEDETPPVRRKKINTVGKKSSVGRKKFKNR